jgi:hypothetical protein
VCGGGTFLYVELGFCKTEPKMTVKLSYNNNKAFKSTASMFFFFQFLRNIKLCYLNDNSGSTTHLTISFVILLDSFPNPE